MQHFVSWLYSLEVSLESGIVRAEIEVSSDVSDNGVAYKLLQAGMPSGGPLAPMVTVWTSAAATKLAAKTVAKTVARMMSFMIAIMPCEKNEL